MKLSKKILILFFFPLFLFGYNSNQAKIIENMIDKQEQIVVLIEDYILAGANVNFSAIGNKYYVDRETIGRYYNINSSFFNNISNENCIATVTTCTNDGGLTFSMVEKNGKYIGIQFYDTDVIGNNCPYCKSQSFLNLYKNIIIGDRIKINNVDTTLGKGALYPLKRIVLDLFTKVEIYYSMYGNSLHIGSNPPKNINKVWIDIRGNMPIERFWYSDAGQWLEKTSNSRSTYVNSKADLLKLPTINGSKIKVLSDGGMTIEYSYNDVYKTSLGCQNSNSSAANYDVYCGWLKVITGMDDYDFIINGIQLANE